ncbi:UNVERIFIED_ORG: DNA-binding transcriptional LysR family regulator [Pseudomonas lini]
MQLDASTQILSLVKREADIAVRNHRPDNPDLIARRIARWPVGLFASQAYVDVHGVPSPGSAFEGYCRKPEFEPVGAPLDCRWH